MLPSIINLSKLNQATMLAKRRNTAKQKQDVAALERLNMTVMRIKMAEYVAYSQDKEKLKKIAKALMPEPLDMDAATDLATLRNILGKSHNIEACCFLDGKYS